MTTLADLLLYGDRFGPDRPTPRTRAGLPEGEMRSVAPTMGEQAAKAADTVGRTAAEVGAYMAMPTGVGTFFSAMQPSAVAADGKPVRPATPEELDREAADNAARRAREPGLLQSLGEAVKGKDFSPMAPEEFRKTYQARVPVPQVLSEQEYVAQARSAVENSPAYKELIKNGRTQTAERRAKEAEDKARADYEKGYVPRTQKAIQDWETSFGTAYADHKSEMGAQLREHQNKSFAERNPTTAAALTYGPLVVGGLAAKKSFDKYNKAGDDLVNAAKSSRASGDVAGEFAAAKALEQWRGPEYWQTLGKTAIKTGAGTVAGRGMMDATDYYLMPKDSGAHQKAAAKREDPLGLLTEYGITAALGAMEGPAIGAMVAKGGPRVQSQLYTEPTKPGFAEGVERLAAQRTAEQRLQSGLQLDARRAQLELEALNNPLPKAMQQQLQAQALAGGKPPQAANPLPPPVPAANPQPALPPPAAPAANAGTVKAISPPRKTVTKEDTDQILRNLVSGKPPGEGLAGYSTEAIAERADYLQKLAGSLGAPIEKLLDAGKLKKGPWSIAVGGAVGAGAASHYEDDTSPTGYRDDSGRFAKGKSLDDAIDKAMEGRK